MTDKIIETLKNVYGSDFTIRKRTHELYQIRKIYYKLCRELIPDMSLNRTGKSIGRDHATVVHSLKSFDEIKKDKRLYSIYIECLRLLNEYNEFLSQEIQYHNLLNIIDRLKQENLELRTKVYSYESDLKKEKLKHAYSTIILKLDRLNVRQLEELEKYRIDPFIKMNVKK